MIAQDHYRHASIPLVNVQSGLEVHEVALGMHRLSASHCARRLGAFANRQIQNCKRTVWKCFI